MAAHATINAFMQDPDALKPNAIHSTSGAKDYGFKGALVGGATAYGWTVGTIVAAVGEDWLDFGFVDLRFRQPVYPGDTLTVEVTDDGKLTVSREDAREDTVCFEGHVGLGEAPWFAELSRPERVEPEPRAETLPRLTLHDAPVGGDLAARAVSFSVADAEAYAVDKERETHPAFFGDQARVHPAWICEQPIHWLHHSYDYGPSIHAQSHIQHIAPARAGQTFVVAGKCVDAYERKGHHYMVNDTEIRGSEGACLAQIRHTVVFEVAKRG